MNKTREFVLDYGCGGLCGVRLYEGEGSEAGEKPVVICSEPPEGIGYAGPSVTNSIELIAARLVLSVEPLGAAVEAASEEDLSGAGEPPFVMVEHYRHATGPKDGGLGSNSPRPDETFDLVVFEDYRARLRGRRRSLGEPEWAHVGRGEVESLIGRKLEDGGWLAELEERLPSAGGAVSPDEVGGGEHPEKAPRSEEIPLCEEPPIGWDSRSGDIILRRVGGPGEVETNVRWTAVQHSPSGFEWGYRGSGPSDLALNVLALFLPVREDGCEPVECFRGEVSAAAFELHQRFKEEFLATMGRQGGVIEGALIRQWIFERVFAAGGRIIVPSGGRLPEEAGGRAP